jgi:hypothetical protein
VHRLDDEGSVEVPLDGCRVGVAELDPFADSGIRRVLSGRHDIRRSRNAPASSRRTPDDAPGRARDAAPMYTNFASATLIVLGVVIAILGFLLAGNLAMVVIGLLSVFAGGLLGLAGTRLSA